jgi:DNA adenine methylase
MRYLGGKSRIAKQLAEVIDSVRHPGQWVWDAFCGGLSMSVALRKKGPVWSTDANAALIRLYQAVQAGWEPPTMVSKEAWTAAKALPDSDPMKAFCGFGCSFGGMWFQSYMKHNPGKSEHIYSYRGLKRDLPRVSVALVDFMSVAPQPCEAILYLDPPYAGTTGYAGLPPFDSEAFVQRVRQWAQFTHVFISEYSLPIGECVWEKTVPLQLAGGTGPPRLERLYYLGPSTVTK